MIISETKIPEVLLFEPNVLEDDRGFFMETFRLIHFRERGLEIDFVQENQSHSKRHVLRGLHFQHTKPQGKLVRVLDGEVFDVAVDLRKSSPTFGEWVGVYLSSKNSKQLWIPPGFAHGFYVVSQTADLAYKCTDYYKKGDEFTLLWSDSQIAIDWPTRKIDPLMSDKDRDGLCLSDIPLFP